ncbi:hypothetical protein E4U31_005379 [Claviceps sp. LM219 group G6]|nr:hypothetical protein E4U31_005379 [Claviceps sp. LM219 group G6]
MGSSDTVGSVLAEIANLLGDGLRIFSFADKRHWGPDEHEQVQALKAALNQAKRDFQHLCPLVNGQAQYEHDRTYETIRELGLLRTRFIAHVRQLKDWSRSGGPINPVWIRETQSLQQDLHRAQCRAAGRIFTSLHESSQRCLGAFLVRRAQRAVAASNLPPPSSQQQQQQQQQGQGHQQQDMTEKQIKERQLRELGACTQTGSFSRFEDDVAFICDFCDGHLLWTDLESVPMRRIPTYKPLPLPSPSPSASASASASGGGFITDTCWQATGLTSTGPEEKTVIFAPVVIANHVVPVHGDWRARMTCPYCEEDSQQPQEKDDEEPVVERREDVFEDVGEMQAHLEWLHAGGGGGVGGAGSGGTNCVVM